MEILNAKRLIKKLQDLDNKTQDEIRASVVSASHLLRNEIVRSIQKGPKSGRVYRRGRIGSLPNGAKGDRRVKAKAYTFHRASAPGEAPATDTGRLVNSINLLFPQEGKGLQSKIGVIDLNQQEIGKTGAPTNVKYALWLEMGTSKVKKRPFIVPAFKKTRGAMQKKIKDAILKGLKNGR